MIRAATVELQANPRQELDMVSEVQVRSLRMWLQTAELSEAERTRVRQAFGTHLKRAELRLRGWSEEPAPEDAAEAALAALEQLQYFAADLAKMRLAEADARGAR